MLFKGPKSLLDSITNVIKDGREQYAKEQTEMNKLVAEKMLSPKQKKIAAVAGHPGKIDAADFAALRSGKQMKENSDMSDKEEKPFKYNKKTGTFDRVKKMDEEVEGVEEAAKWRSSSAAEPNPKHQADVASFDRTATSSALRSKADTPTSQYSLMNRKKSKVATQGPRAGMITKKSAESLKNKIKMNAEETDTPGNGRVHQCAIHVKHATMGEGKTLTTQHAEPDMDGNIEWYDVMFDHGIERVMTEDIEILVSEAHTHSKKKGM